jgi:hypothetical protein
MWMDGISPPTHPGDEAAGMDGAPAIPGPSIDQTYLNYWGVPGFWLLAAVVVVLQLQDLGGGGARA